MIRINCDALGKALSSIKSAMRNDTEKVSLVFDKSGQLSVSAYSTRLVITINVGDCYGNGKFTTGIEPLSRIIANRKTLDLKIGKGKLDFRSGKYKGTLILFPYEDISIEERKKDVLLEIDRDSGLAASLDTARKYLALKDIATRDSIQMNVRIRNGILDCVVNDAYHFGSHRSEVTVEGDVAFNINDETLKKILSLTKNENYDLVVEKSRILVKADNVYASMSMLQMDMKQIDLLMEIMEKKIQSVVSDVEIESMKITGIVENMMAIFESDKVVRLKTDTRLSLSYNTSYGDVGEKIEGKCRGKKERISVSPELLEDTVNNLPGDIIRVGIAKENKNRFLIFDASASGFLYVVTETG